MRQLVHTLLFLVLAAPAVRAGALDVQVDDEEIFENEWVDLVITVNADHVELVPPTSELFDVEALRVRQPMFCMNIGYEVKSAPCRFAFRLTPKKTGRLETPTASLLGDGFFRARESLLTSAPQTITVKPGKGDKAKRASRGRVRPRQTRRELQPTEPQGSKETVFPSADLSLDAASLGDLSSLSKYDAFTLTRPSRGTPYVSEPFLVDHLLYVDHQTVGGVQEVSVPEPEGFRQEPLDQEVREDGKETIGGRRYTVYNLGRSLLIPLETGARSLAPPTAVVSVNRTTVHRGGGGFSISFSSGMNQNEVKGPTVALQVRPVPTPRADGFRDGNVGRFEIQDVEIPLELQAGTWGFVKYRISGEGNLYGLVPPPPPSPPGVTVREPSVDRSGVVTDREGIRGEISVQVPFRVDRTGTLDLGALRLVTLDPDSGQYRSVDAPLGAVTLTRPTAAEAPIAAVDVNEQVRPVTGPDLAPSPPRPATLPVPIGFLVALGILGAAALLPWTGRLLRRRRPVKGKGRRRALGRARQALAELLRHPGEDTAAFYGTLARVVGDYLGDRFDLAPAARGGDGLVSALRELGADATLIQALREELESCDYARFAPSAAQDADRAAAVMRLRDLLDRLDGLRAQRGTP
ncbi:MAG: hypothetical protein ABIK09_01265 [Pseudomonadota bacterium]